MWALILLTVILLTSVIDQGSCSDGQNLLLGNHMMRYPTYEHILKYQKSHRHNRDKRQAIKGSSNIHDVVELDDTESFHGPDVLLPEVSFRDMDNFVKEAQKTVDDRFENLEKVSSQSSINSLIFH